MYKYRAWDLDNHLMYFSDKEQENGEGLIMWEFLRGEIKFSEPQIIDKYCPSSGHVQSIEYRQPNQKIMVFSGRTDKDGVEIFEDDILHFEHLSGYEGKGVVKFKNGCFQLFNEGFQKGRIDFIKMWNDGNHDWYSIENLESFELKILGNIYETPGLLNNSVERL